MSLMPYSSRTAGCCCRCIDRAARPDAEHHRQRRAVDVGVEQAGRVAEPAERHRQVGGHRRLADAALAARHRDHALDLGDQAGSRAIARAAVSSAVGGRVISACTSTATRPRRARRALDVAAHLLGGALVLGLDAQPDAGAPALDLDVAHEAERHDVAAHPREAHRLARRPRPGLRSRCSSLLLFVRTGRGCALRRARRAARAPSARDAPARISSATDPSSRTEAPASVDRVAERDLDLAPARTRRPLGLHLQRAVDADRNDRRLALSAIRKPPRRNGRIAPSSDRVSSGKITIAAPSSSAPSAWRNASLRRRAVDAVDRHEAGRREPPAEERKAEQAALGEEAHRHRNGREQRGDVVEALVIRHEHRLRRQRRRDPARRPSTRTDPLDQQEPAPQAAPREGPSDGAAEIHDATIAARPSTRAPDHQIEVGAERGAQRARTSAERAGAATGARSSATMESRRGSRLLPCRSRRHGHTGQAPRRRAQVDLCKIARAAARISPRRGPAPAASLQPCWIASSPLASPARPASSRSWRAGVRGARDAALRAARLDRADGAARRALARRWRRSPPSSPAWCSRCRPRTPAAARRQVLHRHRGVEVAHARARARCSPRSSSAAASAPA